ncbi:hypothetical protein BD626DRAFT_508786 [Schizophyllum amplum]|uniref:Uncharacterized protein n=1 Tax=Schizophyllum amplum TaxID=97359 RepID=A0A550C3B0_9AGAR|nr:hypothetical protein BD626DRAFT_508786 [Auriculariopsis ampla]
MKSARCMWLLHRVGGGPRLFSGLTCSPVVSLGVRAAGAEEAISSSSYCVARKRRWVAQLGLVFVPQKAGLHVK